MDLIFGILCSLGVIIVAVAILLRKDRRGIQYPIAGWLGSLIVIASFFLPSWINFTNPGVFKENIDKIVQNQLYLTAANSFQEIRSSENQVVLPTRPDEFMKIFQAAEEQEYINMIQGGKRITGIKLSTLMFHYSPNSTLAIFIGVIIGLIIGLLSLLRLFTQGFPGIFLSKVASFTSLLCLFVIIPTIPLLECLGKPDDIRLRLLNALSQAEVGPGGWWMVIGLILIVASSTIDWLVVLRPRPIEEEDEE